eukprot:Hpha_TRINITY_DN16726_c0_g3::TRINITY_DN16726_c0_g3_i1::g.80488::m.80488
MGLGKTWTSIAFMLMWLRMGRAPQLLVIAPKSTLRQWEAEWLTWSRRANHECPEIYVVESSKKAKAAVEKWAFEGGVLILSYGRALERGIRGLRPRKGSARISGVWDPGGPRNSEFHQSVSFRSF